MSNVFQATGAERADLEGGTYEDMQTQYWLDRDKVRRQLDAQVGPIDPEYTSAR